MDMMKSFSIALRSIFKDPINVILVLIPTIVALGLYLSVMGYIFTHSDYLGLMLRDSLPKPEYAGYVGKFLTVLLVLFVFLLMSWTYVIVVGVIAAPFNSMLSSRIEKKLLGQKIEINSSATLKDIYINLAATFKNEAKKLFVVLFMGIVAILLNLFPLFYPLGLLLVAILFSIQFVDYTWSRHNLAFSSCLSDVLRNIIPYALSGFFFLLILTIPIINAIVPALATGYYTVLWLYRQKKII